MKPLEIDDFDSVDTQNQNDEFSSPTNVKAEDEEYF